MTYLHSVGLHVADADARGEGSARDAADHHRHALLAGAVSPLLDLSAQLAVGDVGLVAGAVDGEAPEVLLAPLGQQPFGGEKILQSINEEVGETRIISTLRIIKQQQW